MTIPINKFVTELDLKGHFTYSGDLYSEYYERLIFLEKTHFSQYIPTTGTAHSDYETRLENWLDNLTDEDEKRFLFEFAAHITFLNREDFAKLYQSALEGPISRWIIDDEDLSFTDPSFNEKLQSEINDHTWYLPISDSMSISDFCHTNHLGGVEFRPEFRSLVQFGDIKEKQNEILTFMNSRETPHGVKPLKRLVLLEDFIGSGTQISGDPDILAFARDISSHVSILILPLVICPQGANCIRNEVRGTNISFEPIIELKENEFINPRNTPMSNKLFQKIYDILISSYSGVVGNDLKSPLPYTPFGIAETGASLVMYSNTPANTLPIIQHQSNTWSALFPRSARVK